MKLRPAEEGDEQILYELIRELAIHEKNDPALVSLERLQKYGFQDPPLFFAELAEREGAVAGYALYFYTFSANKVQPILYLEDLYVRPADRGKGIGQALLQKLAQYAVEKECCRMEWHVFDWNESAIAFYEKIGGTIRRDSLLVRMEKQPLLRFAQRESTKSDRMICVPKPL